MFLLYVRSSIANQVGRRDPPAPQEFFFWTLICIVICAGCYFAPQTNNLERLAAGYPFFSPKIRLDESIPLMPGWVWLYYLYFPALLMVAIITTQDRLVMFEGIIAFCSIAILSLLFFLLLPSRMSHPDISDCQSVACRLLGAMYQADNGFNIFPSLHVAGPIMISLFFWRYLRPVASVYGVISIGIIVSTVLVKRHYLVDLPAGALLGGFGYLLGRRIGDPLRCWVDNRIFIRRLD